MPRSHPSALVVAAATVAAAALAVTFHRMVTRRERLTPMPAPVTIALPELTVPEEWSLVTGPVGYGESISLDELLDLALTGRCGATTASGAICKRRTITPPCAAHPA